MSVVKLVAAGESNKRVAHMIGVSMRTIDKVRQSVYLKLNLRGTALLTQWALSIGGMKNRYANKK